MEFFTVGKKYNKGKVAYIYPEKNAPLNNIAIKGNCFLLVVLTNGNIGFTVGEKATRFYRCSDKRYFRYVGL